MTSPSAERIDVELQAHLPGGELVGDPPGGPGDVRGVRLGRRGGRLGVDVHAREVAQQAEVSAVESRGLRG